MKIGFLVGSVSREAGGLFESVRGLAKAVRSASSMVSVFGIRDEKTAADLPQWQPISVHTFSPLFPAWGYSSRLLPSLLEADLDVLLAHGLWKYCSVASHQWHRRTGRPYIVHSHGMLDTWALKNSKWKKRLAALLYEDRHLRGAACIRALCNAEAQSIRAYGLRNPICAIPNGVELPTIQRSVVSGQWSGFPSVAQGRKILLYLGRIHPKKGLANLIRAWADVIRTQNEWMLVIAGWDQGGHEEELKKLTSDHGLLTSVAFLGPLFGEEKAAAYENADAFVLPSLSEGLPMTVLEAWAYAKPVLMTPECNLPEGFAAGAALRIETTANETAAGLKQLLEMTDDDRKVMGERGRALVAEKFSWPQIGEEMHRVCQWIVGGGPPPASVRFD